MQFSVSYKCVYNILGSWQQTNVKNKTTAVSKLYLSQPYAAKDSTSLQACTALAGVESAAGGSAGNGGGRDAELLALVAATNGRPAAACDAAATGDGCGTAGKSGGVTATGAAADAGSDAHVVVCGIVAAVAAESEDCNKFTVTGSKS